MIERLKEKNWEFIARLIHDNEDAIYLRKLATVATDLALVASIAAGLLESGTMFGRPTAQLALGKHAQEMVDLLRELFPKEEAP